MRVSFRLDLSSLHAIPGEVRAARDAAGEAVTKRAVDVMRREAPRRTGVLRETIQPVAVPNSRAFVREIVPFAFYAEYVIGGTGLFGPLRARITAKKGKALRFSVGGQFLFRRSVAGQKPNDFVGRAATVMEGEAPGIASGAIDQIL